MADFLDSTGLSTYDALIKNYIYQNYSTLADEIPDSTALSNDSMLLDGSSDGYVPKSNIYKTLIQFYPIMIGCSAAGKEVRTGSFVNGSSASNYENWSIINDVTILRGYYLDTTVGTAAGMKAVRVQTTCSTGNSGGSQSPNYYTNYNAYVPANNNYPSYLVVTGQPKMFNCDELHIFYQLIPAYLCGATSTSNQPDDVYIHKGCTSIGDYAFYYPNGHIDIYMFDTTPPGLGTNVFRSARATIYVPTSALSAYQSAWSTYSSIIEGWNPI